jgi:hypothetical protein
VYASRRPPNSIYFNGLRHEITLATTDTAYGPLNPFKEEGLEKSLWDFDPGIISLILQPYPNITARKTIKHRDMIARSFHRYLRKRAQEQASPLLQTVFETSMSHGAPVEDIENFESGSTVAALGNTIPGTFWMLYHAYSDSIILKECRNELLRVVITSPKAAGGSTQTLDISLVRSHCPILLSLWQEILRYHTGGISVRMALQD